MPKGGEIMKPDYINPNPKPISKAELNDMNESELVYFIEHKETREWWAGQDENDNSTWTRDPMRAYPFEDKTFASIRAWAYHLGEITEITEHLFVTPPSGGGI